MKLTRYTSVTACPTISVSYTITKKLIFQGPPDRHGESDPDISMNTIGCAAILDVRIYPSRSHSFGEITITHLVLHSLGVLILTGQKDQISITNTLGTTETLSTTAPGEKPKTKVTAFNA